MPVPATRPVEAPPASYRARFRRWVHHRTEETEGPEPRLHKALKRLGFQPAEYGRWTNYEAGAEFQVEQISKRLGDAGTVSVALGSQRLAFSCGWIRELKRAAMLAYGESGTVGWVQSNTRPGDVFYDVGANIGLYTVLAAQHAGDSGHVYAVEAHPANAASLLRNIRLNGLTGQSTVLTCALGDQAGYEEFVCDDLRPGAGLGQLDTTARDVSDDPDVSSRSVELKYTTSIDLLIDQQVIRPADLVKIDVEGGELTVLQGMRGLLASRPPRSIQVEVDPATAADVTSLLTDYGYRGSSTHGSARVAKFEKVKSSEPVTPSESAVRNIIFDLP